MKTFAIVAIALLAGCASASITFDSPIIEAPGVFAPGVYVAMSLNATDAPLRVVNNMEDDTEVTVVIDDAPVFSNVPAGASTDYCTECLPSTAPNVHNATVYNSLTGVFLEWALISGERGHFITLELTGTTDTPGFHINPETNSYQCEFESADGTQYASDDLRLDDIWHSFACRIPMVGTEPAGSTFTMPRVFRVSAQYEDAPLFPIVPANGETPEFPLGSFVADATADEGFFVDSRVKVFGRFLLEDGDTYSCMFARYPLVDNDPYVQSHYFRSLGGREVDCEVPEAIRTLPSSEQYALIGMNSSSPDIVIMSNPEDLVFDWIDFGDDDDDDVPGDDDDDNGDDDDDDVPGDDDDGDDSGSGLSSGAIVAIVLSSAVVVAAAAFAIHRRNSRHAYTEI